MNGKGNFDKTYIAPKTVRPDDKLKIGKDFKSGPEKESNIQREARLKKGLPEFNKYPVTRPVKWSNMPHNLKSR
jgi:hypothetical protein